MTRALFPILVMIIAIVMLWFVAMLPMNAHQAVLEAERAGAIVNPDTASARTGLSGWTLLYRNFEPVTEYAWMQERPRLPGPHQVFAELWNTTVEKKVTSKRSLIYHSWITLSATLLGFALGSVFGILLAIGIVYSRVMDLSVMPWVIASQTIPILALAPMIIVVLNAVGLSGLVPKAIISMYLSFFPVVVGMVKGLRSPEIMQLDQMRTWFATGGQTFWKLRLPASIPYLFASLKVAIAASLVGAIVGELPTGAVAGLGARLLAGSYYGQTIQIWSALLMAAGLAAVMVGLIGLIQRIVLKRMGVF
ncbi:MAG: ABC transporter permease [Pseudomonadota bacterium]